MVRGAGLINRFEPLATVLDLRFLDNRPKIDTTGHVFLKRNMGQAVVHALGAVTDKRLIDNRKDCLGRPKRMIKRCNLEGFIDRFMGTFEMCLHLIKRSRIGPLERIDRLLLVAHDKHSPLAVHACALAGGKFLGQLFDHGPLGWAGVLGFVHQNMVDPAIKTEQDPLRHIAVGQKGLCFAD